MTNEEKYKTPEKRVYAFRKYCRDKVECKRYWLDVTRGRVTCIDRCILNWLALEAEEKLLPCPFCGSVDVKVIQSTVSGYVATCNECWAASRAEATRDDAIAAWNRRAK